MQPFDQGKASATGIKNAERVMLGSLDLATPKHEVAWKIFFTEIKGNYILRLS